MRFLLSINIRFTGEPGGTIPDMLRPKEHRLGSFYLRVGAVAFGIGNMVYSGLEFGQYFELKRKLNDTSATRSQINAISAQNSIRFPLGKSQPVASIERV